MKTILAALAVVALATTAHAETRFISKTNCVRTLTGSSCTSSSYIGPPLYDNSAKVISVPAPATLSDALEAQARDDKWVKFCKPYRVIDSEGVTRLHYVHAGCEFGRSE